MKAVHRILVASTLLLAGPGALAAQDTVRVGVRAQAPRQELPRRVARTVVEFYNRPSTIRFTGRTRIPADRTIIGDVAILGGPVELAGRIEGDVIVLNGDVGLLDGSRIEGDLTIVGGVVSGLDEGYVAGVVTTYMAVFRYRWTDGEIEYLGSEREPHVWRGPRRLRLPRWTMGDSEIYVSARAYNRIEALPIAMGPRITTGGRNPLRIEALLIYRTQAGFDPREEDIGYQVRARQWLGGHRDIWIEGGLQSIIDPIERWRLTNLENSLSLFLFRRDYRDYYEREGWYGELGWRFRSLSGSVEYRDERQRSVTTQNVWTVFFNTDDDYQPNAAIDAGDLQSVALTIGLDTRNDPDDPWAGWYNRARIERAVGGQLSRADAEFTHFFLDFRRYTRVSRNSMVALRAVGGGRIGSDLLPAQRQHVIGGVGSLPAYDQLRDDCGARTDPDFANQPAYGCQRFFLFQAEYRSGLDFRFHWDHEQFPDFDPDIFSVEFEPTIVLFYDAGAAWDTDEDFFEYLGHSNNWVADVGAGLDFGGLGVYLAYPFTGSGGFNFFVRLTGRF